MASNVPPRWASLVVRRQGELDYACGAYCIVTAAVALSTLKEDGDGLRKTLRNLEGIEAGKFADVSKKVLAVGLWERHLAALARAAGLRLKRLNAPSLADVQHGVHIALVRARFVDPRNVIEAYDGLHYVLILEANGTKVVVADPHPWREALSVIGVQEFDRMWTAARGRARSRWAARLDPQ